jgi:hypothetical protein
MVNDGVTLRVFRDGAPLFSAPKGVRVVTDRAGKVEALIGMSVTDIAGTLETEGARLDFTIGPNEVLALRDGAFTRQKPSRLTHPTY